ncbi:MAG TPA: hypothetical protein VLJ86_14650 [Ramlibacter sp.]|nr:hypothetical protein [Ramlibacter sp.]
MAADAEPSRPRYPTTFVAEDEGNGAPETVAPASPRVVVSEAPAEQAAPTPRPAPVEAPARVAPIAPVAAAERPAPAPAPRVPDAAPARADAGLPKVQSFELPVSQLQQVAEGSGLQWVNSDAGKIAAVQAAIAAEPQPAHVPRARPAPIVIDEGPLVLVETKRDLRDVKLPFEGSSAS